MFYPSVSAHRARQLIDLPHNSPRAFPYTTHAKPDHALLPLKPALFTLGVFFLFLQRYFVRGISLTGIKVLRSLNKPHTRPRADGCAGFGGETFGQLWK